MTPLKLLVIKLRSLGDTVLMTAPILEITKTFPHSQIHVLVTQNWSSVLEGMPGISKVWAFERRKEKVARARAMAKLAFQLRKENFDWVINLHASPSSATLAWATGAKQRAIHFHGHTDKNRYSTVEIPGKGILKPAIERDMDTLRALGLHIPAGRNPQIFLHPSEKRSAEQLFSDLNLKGPILGINLGASRPTKSWPLERFAALAVDWCQRAGGSAIAFAGPTESAQCETFMKNVDEFLQASQESSENRIEIRRRITAYNHLSVRQLAAVLSQVSVVTGNDSGPKHIAVAVGTPTVTLFGPENPFEWHPYSAEKHPYLFMEGLPCRKDGAPGMPPWCGLEICTVEGHRCMRMIGVNAVLAECERVAKSI